MRSLISDLRMAFRRLARSPGLALAAVFMLALGIGANTAIYNGLYAVLFRPLPYPEPERLVALYDTRPSEGQFRSAVGLVSLRAWREQAKTLEGVAAYRQVGRIFSGSEGALQLRALETTAGLFEVLGVRPILGRTFAIEDEAPGGGTAVVLSHAFWRSQGGGTDWIGRGLVLDGRACTVVGVMPDTFRFVPGYHPDIYVPKTAEGNDMNPGSRSFSAIARLRGSLAATQAELDAIQAGLINRNPGSYQGRGTVAVNFHQDQIGRETRTTLLLLMGASALLLLIACTNASGLLLARALAREREMAVRAALGATPWALFRSFLVEGIWIAAAGVTAGMLLALAGRKALMPLLPAGDVLGHFPPLGLAPSSLCVAILLGAASALVFAFAPLLQGRKKNLEGSLKQGGRAHSAGVGLLRRILTVASVALCTMLLLSTGWMLRSLLRLEAVDLGFDPRGLYTFQVGSANPPKRSLEESLAFHEHLLEELRLQPGVAAAEAMDVLPFSGRASATSVMSVDHDEVPGGQWPSAQSNMVTPGCFHALGMRMKAGRGILETDTLGAPRVIVVNEALARMLWPGQEPVGKVMRIGMTTETEPENVRREVVGVVENIHIHSVAEHAEPEFYLPIAQFPPIGGWTFVVRSAGPPPETLASAARAELRRLGSGLVLVRGNTMETYLDRQFSGRRTVLKLLGVFAGLALLLAALGVYSTTAFQVEQRRRDTGIRMALGASPGRTLAEVLQQGLTLVLPGIVLGAILALPASHLIASLLYEVGPLDAPTHLAVLGCLLVSALLACLVPAFRASRVDPAVVLNEE